MSKYGNEKVVSHQQKSSWLGFIKSITTFKGDLTSLTAPPFLLSPQSIVEFSAYWVEHPSVFVAPANEPDPEKRALLVLKWFCSTLKEQHNNKDENGKRKKMKPLNPFLGELFLGNWEDEVGTTELVVEQVSHHPPITAFNIWNKDHGIRFQGNVAPKVYFSNTVHIDRKGYSVLHIDAYDEDYVITMPKVHIEGLMTGALFPELSGSSYIRSSSGYTAKMQYRNKGWLGGIKNSFEANLYKDGNDKESLYVMKGVWSDTYTVEDTRTQEVETIDFNMLKKTYLKMAPIETQHPLESKRAWQHVAAAINNGDLFAVGHEKSKIENEQRELRKREKAEGVEFPRRYFTLTKDVVAMKLIDGMKGDPSLKVEDYHDTWLWDEEKYRRLHSSHMSGMKSPARAKFDSGIGVMMIEAPVVS